MGGIGSGRKPKDNNRSLTEQTTFESGPKAARYLSDVVAGMVSIDPDRIRAAIDTRNQVMGKPAQSVDIGIQAEQMESATELLRKLNANRGNGKENDAIQGLGEEEASVT